VLNFYLGLPCGFQYRCNDSSLVCTPRLVDRLTSNHIDLHRYLKNNGHNFAKLFYKNGFTSSTKVSRHGWKVCKPFTFQHEAYSGNISTTICPLHVHLFKSRSIPKVQPSNIFHRELYNFPSQCTCNYTTIDLPNQGKVRF
jgi:hypothetical protein